MGERAVVKLPPDRSSVSDDVLYGRHALQNDVPYIVPEAFAFLEQIVHPWWHVFEWGAGGSTVWFANQCRFIASVEPRLNWIERMRPKLEPFSNVNLIHAPNLEQHAVLIGDYRLPFDLVFVDGERKMREACIKVAIPCVKPGGWLMIDNSDLEEGRGVFPDWERTDFKLGGLHWVGIKESFSWWTSFFKAPYDPAKALRQVAPELFEGGLRVLYVGASPHRTECLNELVEAGNKVMVIEVWLDNVRALRGASPPYTIIEEDVREADFKDGAFDAAIWWHGPDHVEKGAELNRALANLERVAGLVVLAAPWGHCPQGEFSGNPYEAHRWSVYPKDFEAMGYSVEYFGEPDVPPRSFLIASKGAL